MQESQLPSWSMLNVHIDKVMRGMLWGRWLHREYLGVTVNSKILQSVPCKFYLLLDLEFMREIATQVGDSTFKGKEK